MAYTSWWLATLRTHHPSLWGGAILCYGVGDTATTLLGVTSGRVVEAGPISSVALSIGGVPGFLLLKVGFLLCCYLLWSVMDTPGRIGIPLALLVTGLVVTIWNLLIILL